MRSPESEMKKYGKAERLRRFPNRGVNIRNRFVPLQVMSDAASCPQVQALPFDCPRKPEETQENKINLSSGTRNSD
jgi:hypothetical protein